MSIIIILLADEIATVTAAKRVLPIAGDHEPFRIIQLLTLDEQEVIISCDALRVASDTETTHDTV